MTQTQNHSCLVSSMFSFPSCWDPGDSVKTNMQTTPRPLPHTYTAAIKEQAVLRKLWSVNVGKGTCEKQKLIYFAMRQDIKMQISEELKMLSHSNLSGY